MVRVRVRVRIRVMVLTWSSCGPMVHRASRTVRVRVRVRVRMTGPVDRQVSHPISFHFLNNFRMHLILPASSFPPSPDKSTLEPLFSC